MKTELVAAIIDGEPPIIGVLNFVDDYDWTVYWTDGLISSCKTHASFLSTWRRHMKELLAAS